MGQALNDPVQNLGSCRFTQRCEFFQRVFRLHGGPLGIHPDQDHLLQSKFPILNFGNILQLGGETRDSSQSLALLKFHVARGEVAKRRTGLPYVTTKDSKWCSGLAVVGEDAINGVW